MDNQRFKAIVGEQFEQCSNVLAKKEKEYSHGEDRLDQFKIAGKMQGRSPFDSLSGMMIKHTTSIYKMLKDTAYGNYAFAKQWEEKITDHINYLLLLKALLIDITPWGKKIELSSKPETTELGRGIRSGRLYDNETDQEYQGKD